MSSSCCAGSGAGGRRAVHTNPLHALTGGLPFQKHTKPNTVTDDPKHPVAKYPVREVYTNQPLQKNATRVKLFLAFDCAKFKTDNAKAWLERVNSSNKHVVEGRWRLKTENQRMLAAIYVNGRQLRAARD